MRPPQKEKITFHPGNSFNLFVFFRDDDFFIVLVSSRLAAFDTNFGVRTQNRWTVSSIRLDPCTTVDLQGRTLWQKPCDGPVDLYKIQTHKL